MSLVFIKSWLCAAKRHIDAHERYRWWSLYAACLATFMYSTWFWPWDFASWLIAYRVAPWIVRFQSVTWDTGMVVLWVLALVGLVRAGWMNRALAAYGLWMALFPLSFSGPAFLTWLWAQFTWYAFDLPGKWIHGYAGEGTATATLLWFGYCVVVWVALRPLMKRAYAHVPRLEALLLERWPALTRYSKPVM